MHDACTIGWLATKAMVCVFAGSLRKKGVGAEEFKKSWNILAKPPKFFFFCDRNPSNLEIL